MMKKCEQISFDPVALDSEIDEAVKASLEKLAKRASSEGLSQKASTDDDPILSVGKFDDFGSKE